MASLIPAPNAFVARKTPGKQRPAERLEQTHEDIRLNASQWDGHAWGDAAILCVDTLQRRTLPFNVHQHFREFNPAVGNIQIMTVMGSISLEFSVVALTGVGHMSAESDDKEKTGRVFCVAAMWATQRLAQEGQARNTQSVISDIHQRIGIEIYFKQVKRTLEELTAKGSVRFEGDKRWRRYTAVPR